MDKQEFLVELEKRCDFFRNTNRSIDEAILEERDELIGLAKAAVILRLLSQPEAQHMMERLDNNILGAA